MSTTAIYPGSFDPITLGHIDVIGRAAGVFDRVMVGVLVNPKKSPLLELDERISTIREAIDEELPAVKDRVEVAGFDGLTVDYARQLSAQFIVRGLRAISDFESELQMAHTNRKLSPDVDTVFFMTALEHSYLSSSLVKEIAAFGGDVSRMVPGCGAQAGPLARGRRAARQRRTIGTRRRRRRMDIIFLIEQLERLVTSGRNMPLTSNVILDQARALDLLDQLRVAVPEEVRAAKRINDETERIVERAQEEAERILARAQEQAAFLIEERELTRAAEIRSAEIIADGQREADEIRRGADEYAQSVLVKLEGECVKALQSIKRGLALLDERHGSEQRRWCRTL